LSNSKKEQEELELARKQQEKEEELRKRQEEERRRKEEELNRLYSLYGGKENLERIRKAIEQYKKAATVDNGNTALHVAVQNQDEDAVRYLLKEEHADANKPNDNLDIPLHIAASKENQKIVQLLLESRSRVDIMNRDGDSPLHLAAKEGKHLQANS
jgi:ankyrin repeat protein